MNYNNIEGLSETQILNLYDDIIDDTEYIGAYSVWYCECLNGRKGDWGGGVSCYYNRGSITTCNFSENEKWIIRSYSDHSAAFWSICGDSQGGQCCSKSFSDYCPR